MFKINSLIPTININKRNLPAFSAKIRASEGDIFVKQDRQIAVKDCAKSFRECVIKPFSDWQNPEFFEKDSKVTKTLLAPFIEIADSFNENDARYFTRLVFGEDTIDAFETASKRNPDVKLFKETLEKRLGTTIKEFIK